MLLSDLPLALLHYTAKRRSQDTPRAPAMTVWWPDLVWCHAVFCWYYGIPRSFSCPQNDNTQKLTYQNLDLSLYWLRAKAFPNKQFKFTFAISYNILGMTLGTSLARGHGQDDERLIGFWSYRCYMFYSVQKQVKMNIGTQIPRYEISWEKQWCHFYYTLSATATFGCNKCRR